MGNSATGGNSAAWGVATATSPGMLSTTAQDVAGAKNFMGGVQGPGTVPVGCMITAMPNIDAVNAWQPPATGVIKDGFMRADGTIITASHISQGCKLALNTVLPNMIQKYPRGNTTSGSTGGANTVTLTSDNLPIHTHGSGTLVNAPEASHTHSWGGGWSNDNATYYTAPYGDGSQNTYSDGIAGINAWGAGSYAARGTGNDSPDHTHNIYMGDKDDLNCTHANGQNPLADGPGSFWTGITTDGANARHTHDYYLPSHRHWIQARTSGTGASHNHAISGSTSNGGFANTAVNNEPAYVEVVWVIRVS